MARKRIKRYKDWWYQSVLDAIKSYKKLDAEQCDYCDKYKKAIDDAFDYFAKFNDVDVKRIIYMRYINASENVSGISYKLHISEDSVCYWSKKFVYKVAENVGLPKRYKELRYIKKCIEDVHED